MVSNEELYKVLEQSIHSLLEENQKLKNNISLLKKKAEWLDERLKKVRKENEEIKDKNERLKIANAISGKSAHGQLMKTKISNLAKEIDRCIDLIRYNS